MFDESRATEGRGNVIFAPSSDFFLDSQELFQKSRTSDILLRTPAEQADYDAGMAVFGEAAGVDPSEDESSEICGGLVPDGDEDLEALMGYIDGDNLGSTQVADVNDSPYDATSKRKRSFEEMEEDEEEVESKLCRRRKFEVADAFHEPTSTDVSLHGAASGVTQPPGDDDKSGNEFCFDHSADELQMLCDDFGFEMPEQQCSSCSPDEGGDSFSSGSARRSRRQKIKETVKMLREAIPGGECLDTAIVLDEAINYVKLLQLQVQALGAQRLGQRAGR